MRLVALTTTLSLAACVAHGETMTREQTIAEVSSRIGEIQATTARMTAQYQNGQVPISMLNSAIQHALTIAMGLRDELSTNPYIRVSGFSIGVPAGVTVELEFPPVAPPN